MLIRAVRRLAGSDDFSSAVNASHIANSRGNLIANMTSTTPTSNTRVMAAPITIIVSSLGAHAALNVRPVCGKSRPVRPPEVGRLPSTDDAVIAKRAASVSLRLLT